MNVRPNEFQVDPDGGGDSQAYADLVHRHLKRVFAICLSLLGEQADAEDAVQEIFLKGYEKLDSLRDREKFGPWIGQIARNRCRDILRARGRHRQQTLPKILPQMVCDQAEQAPEDFGDLRDALARLPEEHRQPLLLYYFDGRDTRSVARELGLTQGGACARLHRARRQLRALLEETPQEGGVPHE